MSCMYDILNEPMLVARLINFELHIIPCLSSCRLFWNPYLSCFLYVWSVCLHRFIFQVKKQFISFSLNNSYNFTILRSVFYSRNVRISNRNIYISYIHTNLMLLFLLVFAVRSSLLLLFFFVFLFFCFFPQGAGGRAVVVVNYLLSDLPFFS